MYTPMPLKWPGKDSEAIRRPFGRVVISSSSVGSAVGGLDEIVAYCRCLNRDLLSDEVADLERWRGSEDSGFDIASDRNI
jgi:hypothetical protein